jgi:uncharacterized protein
VNFNVSTLLQEPVGAVRQFDVEDETVAVPELDYRERVSGRIHMLRTQRGVLVRAEIGVDPTLECARCLDSFELPLRLSISEEFIPERDPVTGEAVEADVEDFRIDGRNVLDLSEAIRQYEEAALPIQPVCQEQCAGLCPVCGRNRNVETCDCEQPAPRGALNGLAALAERLRAEEHRGGTEA